MAADGLIPAFADHLPSNDQERADRHLARVSGPLRKDKRLAHVILVRKHPAGAHISAGPRR